MSLKLIRDSLLIEDIFEASSKTTNIKQNEELILLYKNLNSYYQIKKYSDDNNKFWYINKKDCRIISDNIIKNQEFMWCHGMNEKNIYLNVLKKVVDKIDIIYDIGSNVGQISLQMRNYFNPSSIYCFEPDYDNLNFSRQMHNEPNIYNYINSGIYYGCMESNVYGRGDNSCGGYFLETCVNDKTFGDFYKNTVKADSKIFKLRELESFDIPLPDLIKIDVEGSEYNIIENSTLFKKTLYLIIEWHFPKIDFIIFSKKNLPNHNIIHKEKTDLGGTWVLKLIT